MALLDDTYGDLAAVVRRIDDEASWTPTGCRGWVVRDLTFHCAADAQRALVALHTPAPGPADTDAVSYWSAYAASARPAGAADDAPDRRPTRMIASTFASWGALRDLYLETAAAATTGVTGADAAAVVLTQGHAITIANLAHTLAVEATLHHHDLVVGLDLPGPRAPAVAEVRRLVESLLGGAALGWDDERVALVGTGRAAPTDVERADLGSRAGRLPVLS